MMTVALVTTLGILGLLAFNEMRYKEITWKDFVNAYLARGIVSRSFWAYFMFIVADDFKWHLVLNHFSNQFVGG